ncbi:MAG: hypothetical protein IH913_08975 [Proteobacteria bacterium]|nr:hypothetical protein [Pseudomonadota bacterium]
MSGEIEEPGDKDEEDEAVSETVADGDIVVDTDIDNVGDLSVEINVEELVAEIESTDAMESVEKAKVRKKLDEIREEHEDELDSTYNFDLDDEDL